MQSLATLDQTKQYFQLLASYLALGRQTRSMEALAPCAAADALRPLEAKRVMRSIQSERGLIMDQNFCPVLGGC
ncbi:hypothetical protein TsFJ059_009409 [Trichoderma semiorbis]|uniref:Uncharacterized protein n=1 Tax=Trichoderma semiorbis TaxID=1491008 RepID=A0A9P8KMG5_9HYPO|nr:hypothetical protein TsFJ059_009409 [Trichoderma semiorbis]